MNYSTITGCQGCGNTNLPTILDYQQMPLVNALSVDGRIDGKVERYPLTLCQCGGCGLVQIKEIVEPSVLFDRNYPYFSSTSPSFVAHAKDLVDQIMRRSHDAGEPLGENSLVVEIASNDGYLLQHFKALGVPVLGVEPATDTAKAAQAKGIQTDIRFFDSETAAFLRYHHGSADVIIGLNVLAHVDNIHGFLSGVRTLLHKDGLVVFEFPHLLRLAQGLAFDTVYHEHLRYYSLHTITYLLALHGLYIVDVEELPTHGGSLRIWATQEATAGWTRLENKQACQRRHDIWTTEDALVRDDPLLENAVHAFADACAGVAHYLGMLKSEGRSLAAYGASAKGTVLLNLADLTRHLDYVVDKSEHKQGMVLPGTLLRIHPPAKLLADMPYAVLLTPWNFAKEILTEQRAYLEAGGRFIIPLPTLRTITKENVDDFLGH